MHLLRLIKTAQPEANLLAAASLLLLLLKALVLNRYPEAFLGAYGLGIVTEGILASVIASYVFYLFIVHLKERRDRAVLYPFLKKHASRVVGECQAQLSDISKKAEITLSFDNLEGLSDAFSKIPPYSDAPLIINQTLKRANWFQYFDFHNSRTRESIRKLLDQLPYLEPQLVNYISSIDDCAHFWIVTTSLNNPTSNPDLQVWADPFKKYCEACGSLENYISQWAQ